MLYSEYKCLSSSNLQAFTSALEKIHAHTHTHKYIMAASQLNTQTPQGSNGLTLCLSEHTRVIAHAAQQYKSGYVTVSRYSCDTSKWRNVHIAKKSFEKLKEASTEFQNALVKGEAKQLSLTKRQFVMITKFERSDKEPVHYISFLHPKTEQETLTDVRECHHSKTINLRKEEYEIFHGAMDNIYQVIITPPKDGKGDTANPEEAVTVKAYQWSVEMRGMKSHTLFPTRKDCDDSVKGYLAGLPTDGQKYEYVIIELDVHRASKMEILEHVFCNQVLDKTGHSWSDLMLQCPTRDEIEDALLKVTKNDILRIAERIAVSLNHKRLYFMSDVYDIFVYIGGIERSKETLAQCTVSPPTELTFRLLDFCYQKIVKKSKITNSAPQHMSS